MPTTIPPWHSLKTRITLATLAIFLTSLWALSFYATRMLYEDMERISGEQQFSTVTYAANEVEGKLDDRIKALELIARAIDSSLIANPSALQDFLDQRFVLHSQFNDGVLAYRMDGTAIAASPFAPERIGVNYLDRDYLRGALKEGKSTIGRPVSDKTTGAPIFVMAVPIFDTQGTVIGALAGVTSLGKPNFLDKITGSRYGKTGGYVLLIPKYRQIITATDKTRIMEILPAPGVIPTLDRFLDGFEGSAVYTTPLKVEVLGSAKNIPIAGWLMGVTLPTPEAFSPIERVRQRMLLATLFLTLLASSLTWWLVRRQLAPLLETTKTLADSSDFDEHPQPLPIQRPDEIGKLIGGFNRLLENLGSRETALKESEERYRTTFQTSLDLINITSLSDGRYIDVNQVTLDTLGYEWDEIVGHTSIELGIWVNPEDRRRLVDDLTRYQKCQNLEARFRGKNGKYFWGLMSAAPMEIEGVPCILTITRDITERKLFNDALLYANSMTNAALESTADGILVVDLSGKMTRWNRKFLELWRIPAERLNTEVKDPVLDYAVSQMKEPERFLNRVLELYEHPDESCLDVLDLLDGRIFERYSQPQRINDKIVGRLWSFRDITEQKKAEKLLLNSQRTLANILNTTKDGYWQVSTRGQLIEVNQSYCHLSGYTREELLGKHISDLEAAENDADVAERMGRIFGTGGDLFETLHRRKDGTVWNVEVSVTYSKINDGEFYVFSRDITERKQSEAIIAKRIVALTQPMEGAEIALEDLFVRDEIQHVQDNFSSATGVASIITYPDGTPFTQPSNFTHLCGEIIRKTERGCANCLRSDAVIGRVNPDGPIIQQCMSGGLWDAGASIIVGGRHIANWLIGQVRDETQTEEGIRAYAQEIGADENAFMRAFHAVPTMSRQHFETIANALFSMATQLSTNAYQNI